jgi:hypothetical protein
VSGIDVILIIETSQPTNVAYSEIGFSFRAQCNWTVRCLVDQRGEDFGAISFAAPIAMARHFSVSCLSSSALM